MSRLPFFLSGGCCSFTSPAHKYLGRSDSNRWPSGNKPASLTFIPKLSPFFHTSLKTHFFWRIYKKKKKKRVDTCQLRWLNQHKYQHCYSIMKDTQLLIKFILRNTAGLTYNILCYLVKNYWFPLLGSQMRQRLQHGLNYTTGKKDNRNHLQILMWHCYYRGLLILTIIIDLVPNYTSAAGCNYGVWFIHNEKPVSGSLISRVSLLQFRVFATEVNFQNAYLKCAICSVFSLI